ncbi:MAG: hypothetical protein H0X59_04145 [Chloroflexi bacterium]|nr:hypothetical protein [Chloroflexota bacterium]
MDHNDEHVGNETSLTDSGRTEANEGPLGDGSDDEEKVAGGGLGAVGGAVAGTAVAGPVGTVVGGALGAAGGALAGDAAEDAANDDDTVEGRDRADRGDDTLI